MPARQITDRAKRYRAQNTVRGKKVCAICGKPARRTGSRRIDVMHLDGNESHGEAANLAYGCRSCNGKLAAAFKRAGMGRPTNQYNPSKGVPTFQQYSWAVANQRHSGDKGEFGAIIHATPKRVRTDYAKRILREAGTKRRAAHEDRWNPCGNPAGDQEAGRATAGMSTAERARALKRHIQEVEEYARRPLMKSELQILKNRFRAGAKAAKRNPRARVKTHQTVEYNANSKRWRRVQWFSDGSMVRMKGAFKTKTEAEQATRGNPAAASAEVFKEFHGHPPREVVTVTKRVHIHEHLAAAGTLRRLVVLGIDNRKHTIKEFGGALLAFNENKNQLFVEGGDQSLNLEDYGIRSPHELETLGKVKKIDYHTDKTHLGSEGGRATYAHQFRTTNENGRHVVVSVSRYPDLIYDVRNQQMLFSGGSYKIRAEGIDV